MENKQVAPNHLPVGSPSLKKFPIDVNVCRNPTCENVGVSINNVVDEELGYSFGSARGELKLQCRRCTSKVKVYSNPNDFKSPNLANLMRVLFSMLIN